MIWHEKDVLWSFLTKEPTCVPLSIAGYSTDSQTLFKMNKWVPNDRHESINKGDGKEIWVLKG